VPSCKISSKSAKWFLRYHYFFQDGHRPPSWILKFWSFWLIVILGEYWILILQWLPAVQKIKLSKIQDGRWPPFWKLLNAISQQPFDQFWWNLVWRCTLGHPIWRSMKNLRNSTSKIADRSSFPSDLLLTDAIYPLYICFKKNREVVRRSWPLG